MNCKKILPHIAVLTCVTTLLAFAGCSLSFSDSSSSSAISSERPSDENSVSEIEVDSSVYETTLVESSDGTYTFDVDDSSGETSTVSFTVTCSEGTADCYTLSDDGATLTFSGIAADSVYSINGEFYGNIVVDAGDDYQFELEMTNFSLTSYSECPLYISSGDKFTLSAKNGTENYIYDLRDEVTEDDDISSSVYSLCDTDVQGKGELYVKSTANNGIHTKDDLSVKNVTLQVECEDNALKGNDSVTIKSGSLTLIARTGDGIKTTNSDISSKGNQRGTVTISGGTVLIYAACDGIDASYDVDINSDNSEPVIQIFTDKYSEYSEEVTATSDDVYYIRYTSNAYSYSICYTDGDGNEAWYNSSSYETVTTSSNQGGMMMPGGNKTTTYYFYEITKPSGYTKMQVYMYSSSQSQGQSSSYTATSGSLTVNDNYDTVSITKSSSKYTFSWTNYTTSTSSGAGGFGGMTEEGNTDKGDYSTKGVKADNEITISSGDIQISSYDDSIHANCDNALENGDSPLGNVTISGGTLSLYSNDDGIHGDGTTTISGGTVSIGNSYEGIEGSVVTLSGGTTAVLSSDDGVNGTGTSGQSIIISGGYLYVYAGGDGVDSNSTSSYNGMLISGGYSVIISTGASDSSLDTENGYKYTGGYILGIDAGGMTNEATACSNFSSYGVSKTNQTITSGNYLTVTNYVTVKLPVSISRAHVIFLGDKSVSLSSASSSSVSSFDSNGVYWYV
ncbi:MAG: carbohydrate-binding domain-containing protein [Clostridia bacterium]|nr:carbohydrate-binding domain-containing protein [Clostridia bacterium]